MHRQRQLLRLLAPQVRVELLGGAEHRIARHHAYAVLKYEGLVNFYYKPELTVFQVCAWVPGTVVAVELHTS